jgi:branched-chain amino acid transport system ATP-binding protein
MGLARTFQNIRLFSNMSVLDNVKVGMHNRVKEGIGSALFHSFGFSAQERYAKEKSMELLKFFDLEGDADKLAGNLPYGAQRRLEIIRALATDPKLLLLDEPAAGMNPHETAELMENILKIRDTFKIGVFLIEHDMNLVMGICEGIVVMNFGKIIAKGDPDQIRNNPDVIEAYLGRKGD